MKLNLKLLFLPPQRRSGSMAMGQEVLFKKEQAAPSDPLSSAKEPLGTLRRLDDEKTNLDQVVRVITDQGEGLVPLSKCEKLFVRHGDQWRRLNKVVEEER